MYAQNVVRQITDRDIKGRRIKNKDVFERILTYLINNFGAPTSLTSLKNYLKTNEKIDIKRETLSRYINILTDAKILYPCLRFDLKSKRSLKAEQKYYLADLSIYFSRNVDAQIHYGPALENIIYTTLRAKGYFVSVGKIGHLECDFICRKNNQYAYFQIAMHLTNQKTEDREYAPLLSIKDNWPKYLLTLDLLLQERAGILHKNMIDCLEKDIDFL